MPKEVSRAGSALAVLPPQISEPQDWSASLLVAGVPVRATAARGEAWAAHLLVERCPPDSEMLIRPDATYVHGAFATPHPLAWERRLQSHNVDIWEPMRERMLEKRVKVSSRRVPAHTLCWMLLRVQSPRSPSSVTGSPTSALAIGSELEVGSVAAAGEIEEWRSRTGAVTKRLVHIEAWCRQSLGPEVIEPPAPLPPRVRVDKEGHAKELRLQVQDQGHCLQVRGNSTWCVICRRRRSGARSCTFWTRNKCEGRCTGKRRGDVTHKYARFGVASPAAQGLDTGAPAAEQPPEGDPPSQRQRYTNLDDPEGEVYEEEPNNDAENTPENQDKGITRARKRELQAEQQQERRRRRLEYQADRELAWNDAVMAINGEELGRLRVAQQLVLPFHIDPFPRLGRLRRSVRVLLVRPCWGRARVPRQTWGTVQEVLPQG